MKTRVKTTHSSLRFLLILAQCFGMLPVSDFSKESRYLKFSWSSKRTIYSIIFLVSAIINTLFFIMKMVKERSMEFDNWVTFLFLSVTVITVIMFLDVAKKWPNLMNKWTEVDLAMNSYGFPKNLQKKMIILTVVIMGAAIGEHSLFVAFKLIVCGVDSDFIKTLNNFFQFRFDYVFDLVKYHIVWGIILQILNIFSTVSWNFMDLFIILMSLCLSERFKQVRRNIQFLALKNISDEKLWQKVREDYTRIIELCNKVDNVMSSVVLVSFANNIFIILVQLFHTLNPPVFVLDKIYYCYSFAFLILRLAAVALYASTISTESKKPRYFLNTLPTSTYNTEIDRLRLQINYSSAALSGHKIFRITRTLILRITVAIVSYELVLVQFLTYNGK